MAHLVDTSVLGRLANTADPFNAVAARAVLELHRQGEVLHVTPQNLVEFRNMATRPVAINGLGLSSAEAEAKAAGFEAKFPLLVETQDIYPAWKALVGALGVVGKQVHDARLVAVCHVYGVTHVLTYLQRRAFRSIGGIWAGPRRGRSRNRVRSDLPIPSISSLPSVSPRSSSRT